MSARTRCRAGALALLAWLAACAGGAADAATGPVTLEAARKARDAGDLERAAASYRSLLEGPEDADAREGLALVLAWADQHDESIALYRDLAARVPQRRRAALREAARVLGWAGRYDQARREAEALLAEDAADVETLLVLGQVEGWAGRTEASLTAYRQRLALVPGDAEARLGVARSLSWADDLAGAGREYEALLAERPDFTEARVGLAYVELWSGRTAAAARCIAAVPAAEANRYDVRLAAAAVARARGDRHAFASAMGSLRREFPGNADVRRLDRADRLERGPFLALDAGGARDSDGVGQASTALRGAWPLDPRLSLAGELRRERVDDRWSAPTAILGYRVGLDLAPLPAVGLRASLGRRESEAGQGGMTGGASLAWRRRDRVRLALSFDRDFAFYTPTAVSHDVSMSTWSLEGAWSLREQASLAATLAHTALDAGSLGTQSRRELLLSGQHLVWSRPLRVELGGRWRSFAFDRTIPDVGYFNPPHFRQALAVVAATWRRRGERSVGFEGTLGAQQVASARWELAGGVRLEARHPVANCCDLRLSASLNHLSLTSGGYAERSLRASFVARR